MSKLRFTLKEGGGRGNNGEERKEYLDKNYYFCEIKLKDEIVILREKTGYQIKIASLKWG